MRISDWSSDVCSSDLADRDVPVRTTGAVAMDFRDQEREESMATDAIEAAAASAAAAVGEALADTSTGHGARPLPYPVEVDHSRDALLTEFGKETLRDRYLLPGESFQDLFVRVASAYADDAAHAQRLYDYISTLGFMPAKPEL